METVINQVIQSASIEFVTELRSQALLIANLLESDNDPETYPAFDGAWKLIHQCNRRLMQLEPEDTFYPSID